MNPLAISVAAAILVDLGYGLLVYMTNPKRLLNQQFALLSIIIGCWLTFIWFALHAGSTLELEARIRFVHITGIMPVTGFNLLQTGIQYPKDSWLRNCLRSKWFILGNALVAVFCMTPFFMTGVVLVPSSNSRLVLGEPAYGPGFPVYLAVYAAFLGRLLWAFITNARRASGMARMELHFILLACAGSILTGSILSLIIPAVTGSSQTAPFAPLGVIVLNAVMAYGIVTRRIMGVATILRRATAYALTAGYLTGLYWVVFSVSRFLCGIVPEAGGEWPHLLAALVVAFSLAPAHGWMQKLATRLFMNVGRVDVVRVVQDAGKALQSIATLDEQFRIFSDIVTRSLGTDRLLILLKEDATREFRQTYPEPEGEGETATPLVIGEDDALITALISVDNPLVVETMMRRRLTPSLTRGAQRLADLKVSAAVGIRRKNQLTGIILLGPRLSGRVYGVLEQDAIQTLSNQMAVAIENAKLFTKAQNSRIYNDILLDNLVSGVVASGTDRVITVFNREAQRITKMAAPDVIGQDVSQLPEALSRIIVDTLDSGRAHYEEEWNLNLEGHDPAVVRLGSSVFKSLAGETLGALLVFHDVTALKVLQEQIRRSDRLASMGTLSAGMAHEIKNPLVTIKTFTQLLPERFDDQDFREDFTELVGDEVKRIDGIVSQLLTFARPSKPSFSETHMHDVLENSLRLVMQEFTRKNVTIIRSYDAPQDTLMGDADLLGQA